MMFYLKKKNKIALFSIFLFLMGMVSLQAQHKKVQVRFQIFESDYKEFYKDSLSALEKKGAELICHAFQEEFPFVKFTNESADNQLFVFIQRQDPDNPGYIFAVELGMFLLPENGTKTPVLKTDFRGIDQAFAPLPGSHQAFLLELKGIISSWAANETEMIISELMSQVSLGEKARPVINHPVIKREIFLMPFSKDSLYIGELSEFSVIAMWADSNFSQPISYSAIFNGGTININSAYPEEYRGNFFIELDTIQPESLKKKAREMLSNADLPVEGIFIKKFIRSTIELIDPSSF